MNSRLVGNLLPLTKVQQHRFRCAIGAGVWREDSQVSRLTFACVVPGTFQIGCTHALETQQVRLRCFALQLFIFIKAKMQRIGLAVSALILCDDF
ncbi:hypothetical protein D3C85_1272280 [compost metagenome]